MLQIVEEKVANIKNNMVKKSSFSAQQCIDEILEVGAKIENSLDRDGMLFNIAPGSAKGRLNKVDEIKRYDVLYISILGGIPHYMIVDRVFEDGVYCLVVTSKFKEHLILDEIKGDRIFNGNFVTNTYMPISMEEAKKSFVRVYEDKAEAYRFFQKVKKYYKQLFEKSKENV